MKTTPSFTISLLGTALLTLGIPAISSADPGTVSAVCGQASGTRFNLEPRTNAVSQGDSSVDFLYGRVSAGVDLVVGSTGDARGDRPTGAFTSKHAGYYVSRDADCGPEFEGGLPAFTDPAFPAPLFMNRSPKVVADPARDAVFMAGVASESETFTFSLAIARSSAATLMNPTSCPAGTHTETQAATCWPTKKLVGGAHITQGMDLAVDERPGATGGTVYLTGDQTVDYDSAIVLVACRGDLSACSPKVILARSQFGLHAPNVAVRPDGRVSVTWQKNTFDSTHEIWYRSCAAAAPPAALLCKAPVMVANKTQLPNGGLGARHANRNDTNGTETYVVWARCKTPNLPGAAYHCPDVDLVMSTSSNDGATWSATSCVDCSFQQQFLSDVGVDRSRNVINIAYYSSVDDVTFQSRLKVKMAHLNPGAATPDTISDIHSITTMDTDPGANPTCGSFCSTASTDYIGVSARGSGVDGGSRTYIHYQFHNVAGIYNGIALPEPNNHLSRVDY
jgi:hypothetical protein